ncbi:MAG: nucleotide sugar dehydrogenase, partial [Bacteroidota bacterium]|nr:nucleotide sugar dehydrogenase [Bacteroidota bacterium]
DELNHEYGFELTKELASDYEVVIVTVPHKAYLNMDDEAFAGITKSNGLVADIKGVFRGKISSRKYWSL